LKKLAVIFILAVLVPGAFLAVLAIRAQGDQNLVVERQRALVNQGVVDALSVDVNVFIDTQQAKFRDKVDKMLVDEKPEELAVTFDRDLRESWGLVEVGFIVGLEGDRLLAPQDGVKAQADRFIQDNRLFLCAQEEVPVYAVNDGWGALENSSGPDANYNDFWKTQAISNSLSSKNQNAASSLYKVKEAKKGKRQELAEKKGAGSGQVGLRNRSDGKKNQVPKSKSIQTRVGQSDIEDKKLSLEERGPNSYSNYKARLFRSTVTTYPKEEQGGLKKQLSNIYSEPTGFQRLTSESEQGTVVRFLRDELNLFFWYRPLVHPRYVFGVSLDMAELKKVLAGVVDIELNAPEEVCVSLLDDRGGLVAKSVPEFETDWRRPFVSTEIGEVLPHWEIAAYLVDPGRIGRLARVEQMRLWLLVLGVFGAIGIGGFLLIIDAKRSRIEVRQKTDFVSNVSHELKTPLTSIRMFSEMLADEGALEDNKRRRYAEVIRSEASRLARLINNVLDFSRLERGEREFCKTAVDLPGLVEHVVGQFRPQLEGEGFSLKTDYKLEEAMVSGDQDALAQVLMNLLSNAEKYSGDGREIEVSTVVGTLAGTLEVQVCDRGPGVSKGREKQIFERFYRGENSLASGIQGSGLGLSLARQIAREHGGDIEFQRRDGGGSCFVLRLPVVGGKTRAKEHKER